MLKKSNLGGCRVYSPLKDNLLLRDLLMCTTHEMACTTNVHKRVMWWYISISKMGRRQENMALFPQASPGGSNLIGMDEILEIIGILSCIRW